MQTISYKFIGNKTEMYEYNCEFNLYPKIESRPVCTKKHVWRGKIEKQIIQ